MCNKKQNKRYTGKVEGGGSKQCHEAHALWILMEIVLCYISSYLHNGRNNNGFTSDNQIEKDDSKFWVVLWHVF